MILLVTPLLLIASPNTGGDDNCIENHTVEDGENQDHLGLPKVFLIGEYAEEFDLVSAEYNLQLLEACGNDMNLAYFKWLSMLKDMEDYAETLDFPLKGVKMWIKVFWAKDGTIDHIAYYLKPHSRNVEMNEMAAFFSSFMEQYQFPLITEAKYSNYGSASFPVLSQSLADKEKN